MIHKDPSPLAGKTVKISDGIDTIGGREFRVEDWWDRVSGKSWMDATGNPGCMQYAIRSGFAGLPTDNEVLYGKLGSFGALVHVSEIEKEEPAKAE